jgi:pimeloyl-ACP methyl ester carboxylesterase
MISYPVAIGSTLTRLFAAGTDGPPVVLVHGLTSRADRWRHNMDALAAAGYRVYAPDLPGHGFAAKSAAFDHSTPGYADFIVGLLDQIGAERVTLVGTSLGGHVVGAVAAQQPQRIDRLVMIGSLGLQPVTADKVQRSAAGLADMRPEAMRARLLTVFSDPRHVTDDLVREDVAVNTSPGAAESFARFLDYFRTGFNEDLVLDRLAALQGRFPLLLLWGEADKSVPVEIGRAAHQALPQSRLVVFKNTSHTPYWEHPALFNRTLLEFLQGDIAARAEERSAA